MQALYQIIAHKMKFMSHFEQQQKVLNSQQLMDLLLKQKKNESINEVIQNRLVQTILSRRIQAPYSVQDFLDKSSMLMKLCSPDFYYSELHSDMYTQIVETYIAFFNYHGCQLRSQQIAHVFYKRLCEKSMLLPTLFNWFSEWTRKRYNNFLKINLNKIYEAKRPNQASLMQRKSFSPPKRILRSQLQQGKAKVYKEESSINIHQIIDTLPKQRQNNSSMHPYRSLILKSPNHRDRSLKSTGDQENSQCISPTKQKKQKGSNCIKKQWPSDCNLVVNRDTFCGAYNQEIQSFYSQFSGILLDLDINYVKGVRKNDKKAEYGLKIKQIAGIFAKNQGQIRKSIQSYFLSYYFKFPNGIQKSPKKQNSQMAKRTVKRKKVKLWEDGQNKILQQQEQQAQLKFVGGGVKIIKLKKSQSNESLQKNRIGVNFDNSKILKNHRTIELRLPQLPQIKNKQVQQLKNNLMSRRSRHRYPNSMHLNSHIKHIKNSSQDISVEIRKQIRQMNKLYRLQQKEESRQFDRKESLKEQSMGLNQPQLAFGKYQIKVDRQALLKEFRALGRKSLDIKKSIRKTDMAASPNMKHQRQYNGIFYFPRVSK